MVNVYHFDGYWKDLTPYILKHDMVQRVLCNRDYSLRAEPINFTLSSTVLSALYSDEDYSFLSYDYYGAFIPSRIKITVDSVEIWSGYVSYQEYIYREMEIQIRVDSFLSRLKSKLVDYTTLHNTFAGSSNWYEYKSSNYYSLGPIIGVLYSIKQMMYLAGVTLECATVLETDLFTNSNWEFTVKYKDLFFFENVLYAVNQSVACNHTTIDDEDNEYNANKIDCFTLVSKLFSYLNLRLVYLGYDESPNPVMQYNVEVVDKDLLVIDEADTFEYAKARQSQRQMISTIGTSCSINTDYSTYVSATPSQITTTSKGGGHKLEYLSNFVILASNARDLVGDYAAAFNFTRNEPKPLDGFILDNNSADAAFNPIYNILRDYVINTIKETILTNYQSADSDVLSHKVDLEWENSEIEQEAYSE